MKKLLIISFYFPPTGVGGAIRITKFTKYLPSFNIEPIVITTFEDTYGVKDFSLLKDLPENLKIFRVSAFYIFNYMSKFKFLKLNQIVSFIGKNFIWPDAAIYWAKKASIKASNIIENEKINYLLTTGGPFSTHLIGLYLKEKFPKIHWIADFRDEWSLNPFVKYGFFRRLYETRLEKKVMQKADKVITVSNYIKDKYIKLYPFLKEKISVIYNGFDEVDFDNYKKEYVKSNVLNIGYLGSIYNSKRNPKNFFKAISILNKDPEYKNKINLEFIGHDSYILRKYIKKYRLNNCIKIIKRIPHKDLFININSYDCFLLVIGKLNRITGKIFEYLRLQKPIFAIGKKEFEVAQIIKRTNSGIMVDISNVDEIIKTLKEFIELKKTNSFDSRFKFIKEEIERFNRKNLTEQLVKLMYEIKN